MISYYDFKKYQDYLKEAPPVSWLPEFDKYVSEKYGVKLMPTFYDEEDSGNHYVYGFSLTPYSDEDFNRLCDIFKGKNNLDNSVFENGIGEIISEFMNRYNSPEIKENGIIYPFLCQSYLLRYRCNYLLRDIKIKMWDELKKNFDYLKPYRLDADICILKTRKQAAEFYRSAGYKEICRKYYEAIKPFDEYDVLRPEHIHIFVDYKKNYENTPMHGRWVHDMGCEEFYRYMDSL